MEKNKTKMKRLVNVLKMKMPINIVGESDDISGNKDKIRAIIKEKPDSIIFFVIESSPKRTEHVVENVLDDHNAQYQKKEPRGQMRVKYVVKEVDEKTFA